jgi:hypothetical protein
MIPFSGLRISWHSWASWWLLASLAARAAPAADSSSVAVLACSSVNAKQACADGGSEVSQHSELAGKHSFP